MYLKQLLITEMIKIVMNFKSINLLLSYEFFSDDQLVRAKQRSKGCEQRIPEVSILKEINWLKGDIFCLLLRKI